MIGDTLRVQGNYVRNPMQLTLLNVSSAKLIAEGQEIPTAPYMPHFDTRDCIREYMCNEHTMSAG